MGRGRGKGKKQSVIAAGDDPRNEGDENLPLKRRVGRPQKTLKAKVENENEYEMLKEDEGREDTKSWVSSESSKNQVCMDSGRKRKRASQLKEDADSVKEENDVVTKTNATVLIKTSVGYRQIGSRRKSTPRRAAEVGVECS
ncbi:hypothetical protein F511_03831 [Dorcoceras hygrometricum]|uniref:Uncharacterized protein n=1 Tax=Dorcoceras hygrometricum TaxID=472368 RepID=A0A2Z7BW07_9LAMI|nr:hypothetical protein F511_03831 [Dorcoceras hygrometricum]